MFSLLSIHIQCSKNKPVLRVFRGITNILYQFTSHMRTLATYSEERRMNTGDRRGESIAVLCQCCSGGTGLLPGSGSGFIAITSSLPRQAKPAHLLASEAAECLKVKIVHLATLLDSHLKGEICFHPMWTLIARRMLS